MLRVQATTLHQYVPRVLEDVDPANLNRVLVALRRTFTILQLFAPALGKRRAKAMREQLRHTKWALVALAQLDALIPRFEGLLQAMDAPPHASVPILSQLTIKRVLARHEVYVNLLDPSVVTEVGELDQPDTWAPKPRGRRPLRADLSSLLWEQARPLVTSPTPEPSEGFEAWRKLRNRCRRLVDSLVVMKNLLPLAQVDLLPELEALHARLEHLDLLSHARLHLRAFEAGGGLPQGAQKLLKVLLRQERINARTRLEELAAAWEQARVGWGVFQLPPEFPRTVAAVTQDCHTTPVQ